MITPRLASPRLAHASRSPQGDSPLISPRLKYLLGCPSLDFTLDVLAYLAFRISHRLVVLLPPLSTATQLLLSIDSLALPELHPVPSQPPPPTVDAAVLTSLSTTLAQLLGVQQTMVSGLSSLGSKVHASDAIAEEREKRNKVMVELAESNVRINQMAAR